MKIKPRVLMSLLLALIAMILVSVYINTKETVLLEDANKKDVVIATEVILANTPIQDNQVKLAKIPQKWVQPSALNKLEDVIGKISSVPIQKDAQILGTYFSTIGTSLSFKVPRGKRAVSIAISDVTGVANLVQPGNFVDIVGLFKFGSFAANANINPLSIPPNQQTQALTLFQNVQVLATGQDVGGGIDLTATQREKERQRLETAGQGPIVGKPEGPESYRTVTLAMTPEAAQDLIFAQHIGDLALVLRSYLEGPTVIELKNSSTFSVLKVDVPIVPRHGPSWREIRGGQ